MKVYHSQPNSAIEIVKKSDEAHNIDLLRIASLTRWRRLSRHVKTVPHETRASAAERLSVAMTDSGLGKPLCFNIT